MSSVTPRSPPGSPKEKKAKAKKENELKLKEAKARKKEAQKDLSRAKEQLAQTNASVKATDEEVARLENNLAVQERNLRERDRSLHYLTEMLSSSSNSRIGGSEIITSVFGKLARLGSGKKKAKKSTHHKKAAAHQHHPGEPEDFDDDVEEKADGAGEGEGVKEKPKITLMTMTKTNSAMDSEAVSTSVQTTPRGTESKSELDGYTDTSSEEEAAAPADEDDEDDDDDGGFFIFDLRSKMSCELAGSRNVCTWEEFNHLSANLRFFRDYRAHEVAELFVLVPAEAGQPSAASKGSRSDAPTGLQSLMASIQRKTRAPIGLIESIFRHIEKAVGPAKTCTCIFIGLVSVGQAATSLEKEALLFDAITGKNSGGMMSLEAAKALFHYRLRFVEAIVRASPPAGGRDEKEIKKGLKKLFGKRAHERNDDNDKVWNRAAAAVFQFIEKQRAREQRTRIDDEDEDDLAQHQHKSRVAGELMLVTRSEWVHAMQYFAHFFHEARPAPQLCRGDGLDELDDDAAAQIDDDAASAERSPSTRNHSNGVGSKASKKLPTAGESGESVDDCETDNEEYCLSDYEIDDGDDQAEHGREKNTTKATKRHKADWEVEHAREVATFVGGLNAYLRPAAASCRAVLPLQTLLLPSSSTTATSAS